MRLALERLTNNDSSHRHPPDPTEGDGVQGYCHEHLNVIDEARIAAHLLLLEIIGQETSTALNGTHWTES